MFQGLACFRSPLACSTTLAWTKSFPAISPIFYPKIASKPDLLSCSLRILIYWNTLLLTTSVCLLFKTYPFATTAIKMKRIVLIAVVATKPIALLSPRCHLSRSLKAGGFHQALRCRAVNNSVNVWIPWSLFLTDISKRMQPSKTLIFEYGQCGK